MENLKEIVEAINNHEPIICRTGTKTKEEVVKDLLSYYSEINVNTISNGHLKKDDWPLLIAAAGKLSKATLVFWEDADKNSNCSQYRVINL